MIELIFAIVVIGITVISLPMMIQVNSKGIQGNVKQEVIFATSAKMMQVLSYAWDQNSTDVNISSSHSYSKVIDVTGEVAYNRIAASIFRVGHIQQGLHRRFFDTNEIIVTNIATSIEGQNGVSLLEATDKDGYKYNMQLSTVITNIDDTIPIGNFNLPIVNSAASNIKLITITTTLDGNNDGDYTDNNPNDPNDIDNFGLIDSQVVLRSYATNIGEIDYNKRRY